MRRIIQMLVAIMLFFSMTTAVMAESIYINTDKGTVSRGETVTVEIYMNEKLSGEFRNVQGQLVYDPELVTYVSHEMGEDYSNYTANDFPDRKYFTFTNTDFTAEGFREIPEGKAVAVTFEVNKKVKEEHLSTSFLLQLSVQDISGKTEELAADTSVLICNGHEKANNNSAAEDTGTDKQDSVCDNCGQKYTVKESTADENGINGEAANDFQADVDDGQEKGTNRAVAIVVIIAVAIAAAVAGRKIIKR